MDGRVFTKYDFPLKEGQIVRIVPAICGQKMEDVLQNLFEDADLIVINKPTGLLFVTPATAAEWSLL